MNNLTKVTANDKGLVLNQSKNPEYGFVRVEQTRDMFVDGFYKPVNLSALITGKLDALRHRNFQPNEILPGKVIVIESTKPFNKLNPENDLKLSGKDGIPCTSQGQYIYRKTKYTENLLEVDTLIQHDNVDELKSHNSQKQNTSSSDSTDDFPM